MTWLALALVFLVIMAVPAVAIYRCWLWTVPSDIEDTAPGRETWRMPP